MTVNGQENCNPVEKSSSIVKMGSEIEIFHENLSHQLSQRALKSEVLPYTLKEGAQSKTEEEMDIKTILNHQKSATDSDLHFLNNKNNLVNNVQEVNLSCGLTQIPKMVCNLKYLTELNLSGNSLETLPNEIGNMCNLSVLKLSGNKLSYLPKPLKHVQQLSYLDISRNRFSEVPDVLYFGLRALKVLDLSFNEIISFRDFPACLNKLVVLKMSNNLINELPVWFFDSLCQLKFLYLDENLLHLETEFFDYCSTGIFESLELLNVENCSIKHEGTQIFSLFKNLKVIQMGNKTCSSDCNTGKNYMGNLKSEMFKNSKKLKFLHLENTQIATLPSDFDCLKNIEVLDLSDNILSWLPECFCNLVNLRIINLTSNQLLFLPDNIDKLVNLREIHLGNNKLYQIPDCFSNLRNLEFVDLYNNQIEKIDLNIIKGKQLKGIDLGLNYIQFDLCGCSVDVDELVLYNFKKDFFRNHFSNMSSRSDVQKTKLDGGCDERNTDSYSNISSYESELSDIEDLSIDQKADFEPEDWEEKNLSPNEEDESFDPNEQKKFERRCNVWSSTFRNNYCPARGHLPPLMRGYIRKRATSSKNETVEDGQFDSD